jgi:poly(A) polymerase
VTAPDNSPHLGDAPWLRPGPLAQLLAVLDRDGEEARVVGGAVRNALLEEPIGDIDVATTARPQEVVRRAEQAGFKAVPTGIEHGTVMVVVDRAPFEVTTLREDIETFGRKATVRFGRDWKADAERRDFTINALSAARDGAVHDHVGGLADLRARRVRFIGDPQTRIREDYLRILRFFRFQATYGSGPPDAAGIAASILLRAGLDRLSRERVRMELLKLLTGPHVVPTVAVMAETGILGSVLGGVPLLASFANLAKVEAAAGLAPDPIRRLGALNVLVAEDADRLHQRLRLTNAEYERLASMAERWWAVDPARGEQMARALLYRIGPDQYVDRVLLAWARSAAGAADTAWRDLAALPNRWIAPRFPLRAADFLRRGISKGPALGAALEAAEEAWIARDFPADDTTLAKIVEAAARSGVTRPPAAPRPRRLPPA